MAIGAAGTVLHLTGYGSIRVFRLDAPDGDTEWWATNDLGMDELTQRQYAEQSFAIENYHRDLKQDCGVEKCQIRSERAQQNHIGLAIWAFLRLEWYFFTTGVTWFMVKSNLVREAIRAYLAEPFVTLPKPSTA